MSLVKWLIPAVVATALFAGCGQGSHRSSYERAAVKLVRGFGKHITVRTVACSHIRGNAASCSLTDSQGTSYSCDIALGPATYTVNQCLWSRGGAGGAP
jgi:hypothetical protein